MQNNIKKASVKFLEDLLYFRHFIQIFVFALNPLIITTLNNSEFDFPGKNCNSHLTEKHDHSKKTMYCFP